MATGDRADPGVASHFAISGVCQEIDAIFSECSGLQLELEVFDYQEGGQNDYVHKLPGRLKQGNITLRRGIVKSDSLLTWVLDAFSGKLTRKDVAVSLFAPDGKKKLMAWELSGAYPVKWVGPALKAADNSIAVDTFELAYKEIKFVY